MPQQREMLVTDLAAATALLGPLLAGRTTECLAAAHLDNKHRLLRLGVHLGAEPDRLRLPFRWLLREALKVDARKLLIAHNHPSGAPEPSRADKIATRDLAQILARTDVQLVDHLLFAGDRVVSFRAIGLI